MKEEAHFFCLLFTVENKAVLYLCWALTYSGTISQSQLIKSSGARYSAAFFQQCRKAQVTSNML